MAGFGIAAEQVVPMVSRLGDVAQGDVEKLKRLSLQFGQVMSADHMKKQEFNIFAEAGADMSAFARAFGGTMKDLLAGFEAGAVGADVMVKAFNEMTSAGGRFYQMNDKMSKTLGGQWSNLVESIDLLKTKAGLAFMTGFKPGEIVNLASDQIGKLTGQAEGLVVPFEKARKVFDGLVVGGLTVATSLFGRLDEKFGNITKGADGLGISIKDAMKVGVVGIGTMLDKLDLLRQEFGTGFLVPLGKALELLGPKKPAPPQPRRWGDTFADALTVGPAVGLGWDKLKSSLTPTEFEALQKFGEAAGAAGGGIQELGRSLQNRLFEGMGEKMGKDFDRQWDAFGRHLANANKSPIAALVDLIRIPAQVLNPFKVSDDAAGWLKEAGKPKELSQYDQLQRLMGFRNEIAAKDPGKAGLADNALAHALLGFDKAATALEYKLPEALHAGSAEAYSVVAAAVSGDNGKETGEDRVARILNALKTTADDQASTLKDIKRALAARPGGFDF